MTILAVDTSSQAASCALWQDGVLAGEFFCNVGLTHSQTAMPMVEALLHITGVALPDVDVLAVTTGPGSFTGLRIGIASVKGMAMALDKPCAGVSTLEALAAGVPGFEGYVAPVMDARRSQVYTALFRSRDGVLERLSPDQALSVAELGKILAPLDGPVMLVGDGSVLCYQALKDLPNLRLAPEGCRHQRAGWVAAVAAGMAEQKKLISAEQLAPAYLRLPQAERERMEREQQAKLRQQ